MNILSNDELNTRVDALEFPRVTPESLQAVITGEEYFVSGTLTICTLLLRNGFKVIGESACVDPRNFDEAIGRTYARKNAESHIWKLEGYALAERVRFAQKLRELIAVQCMPGTVDADEYMRGMANGLIVALSVIDGAEPQFVEPPAAPVSTLPPHQQRVIAERNALSEDVMKLGAFLDVPLFKTLCDLEQNRMAEQFSLMTMLLDVLNARIDAF